MVVVLPAPFGPTKPTTCPDEKANETSSTARVTPKCFFRLTTSIFICRLRLHSLDSLVRTPECHKQLSTLCAKRSRANLLREIDLTRARPDNNPIPPRPVASPFTGSADPTTLIRRLRST